MLYELYCKEEQTWKHEWQKAERKAWDKARMSAMITFWLSLIALVIIGHLEIFKVTDLLWLKVFMGPVIAIIIMAPAMIIGLIDLKYEMHARALPLYNAYLHFHRARKSYERRNKET